MASETSTPAPEAPPQLEGGAYEVIRARMEKAGTDLRARLDQLNHERLAVFGGVETKLLATERVATEHNCLARDLVAIGPNRFIFGYNIQFGLKATTDVRDVFSIYDFDAAANTFSAVPAESTLGDPRFAEDFAYLYKFYRETSFKKFFLNGPHLYMVMRAGKTLDDIKVFKWLVKGDNTLEYLGNRFDHEYVYPQQQEFTWRRAVRDMQRGGLHPHLSIEDIVFVETIGGDLTIKVEDNTESGRGIYSEPVSDPDQTLDDAEIHYAVIGSLVLLKILPYRENAYRYLAFCRKTHQVFRIDAIGSSCVLLPDDHGIIFANGYLLQTGDLKTFDHGIEEMRFERRIASANGEDVLFWFYNRTQGNFVLLAYNRITQTVDTPIVCAGASLFANGKLVLFRGATEPQKYHALQIWETPFFDDQTSAATANHRDSFLFKLGNPEIVRVMAECHEVLHLLAKDDSFSGLYLDLAKHTSDLLDAHFWLDRPEGFGLAEPLAAIRKAAQAAIGEFEKVTALRQNAATRTAETTAAVEKLVATSRTSISRELPAFVHLLTGLRKLRGEIIALREVRYTDPAVIESLEKQVVAAGDAVAEKTVDFLATEQALAPYAKVVDDEEARLQSIKGTVAADESLKALDEGASELEMLIEVVGGLKIRDPQRTSAIVERISAVFARLNGARNAVRNHRRELSRGEAQAEFGARMSLLGQALANHLDLADSPERCDEALTKLLVQVEELEGRFSDFEEYVDALGVRREEIQSAFDSRRAQLLEARNRRAANLLKSGERILNGIKGRIATLTDVTEIQGYFAGDLMLEKIRSTIDALRELGDAVKADDLQTRLKTLQEDSIRQLKDRKELFADGGAAIQLGRHKFSVNTQALELTIVPQGDGMAFHLAGTKYHEAITDPDYLASSDLWDRDTPSESPLVYRGEFLAWLAMDHPGATLESAGQRLDQLVRERHADGYTKGVHDADALKFIAALLPIRRALGLAAYGPDARALAMVFWRCWEGRDAVARRIEALRRSLVLGAPPGGRHELLEVLETAICAFLSTSPAARLAATCCGRDAASQAAPAAEFLYRTLLAGFPFVVSSEAAVMERDFASRLLAKNAARDLDASLASYSDDPDTTYRVLWDWFRGAGVLTETAPSSSVRTPSEAWLIEAAAHRLYPTYDPKSVVGVDTAYQASGLLGTHPLIQSGAVSGDYHALRTRVEHFIATEIPRYQSYAALKHRLVAAKRATLRLDTFKPRVMSAFVRNRLIDEVYLPLIGDNLAKQLGATGTATRTDRMGLLLLISPPGYGKTTLVEYIADRLGVTYIKINGPALGHSVLSLDPAEAPNAAAREEIERLNLALEMGDNVMIVIDDIQHTNPEFLQKFISLCDAQRKIEGVYQGKARTYDLRGRKVAVVMAGNPYTESGAKFQIPDMLANRADTYNLGDILGGHEEAFKTSYIENTLTSNPVLSKLAARSPRDIHLLLRVILTGSRDGADFEGNHTPAEVEEMLAVVRHLVAVRDVILRVNQEYIASAGQEDSYRTEPPFRLQGSYRNMNRIAEKILPLMTAGEVRQIVMDHYRGESQNLTTAAEANMLKLREMLDTLDDTGSARWAQIKKDFGRKKLLGGAGESDPVARVVAQMSQFTDGLDAIRGQIADTGARYGEPQTLAETTVNQITRIIEGLRAVPVQVEIKVVPVQDGGPAPAQNIAPAESPVAIAPTVVQGEMQDAGTQDATDDG
ncbi:MAG: DNA repair ATPase [Verrucomicrobia bacterium]|nr:DNA repair ATPase [Verrucomicrobiota bacterium]